MSTAISPAAALEFVRRLALAAVTGNGDMHLKNWSLLCRGDVVAPTLVPICDMLSTVPYIPADAMALSLGGERSFKALSADRWRSFANRARLPEPVVLLAVADTVARVNEQWWRLEERAQVPATVLERIGEHVKAMTPILNSCAER